MNQLIKKILIAHDYEPYEADDVIDRYSYIIDEGIEKDCSIEWIARTIIDQHAEDLDQD
jgi:hypothetical protein